MASKRDNGTGTIYQRSNGSWVGKIYLGRGEDGKEKFKYLSGKTEAEVKRKIREFNKSNTPVADKRVILGEYAVNWLRTYKKGTVKESSYDALEKTMRNHVIPNIGMIQLHQVTPADIQKVLTKMKDDEGYSHSTIKKVYDFLGAMFRYAVAVDDVAKNPMLLVAMPDRRLFDSKEIRYFTQDECKLIVEESSRCYKTGTPVYQYADVYILMLHTGIRLGEAIGLLKTDWNRDERTLHIQRNIQPVANRDDNGNRLPGVKLSSNTTKTYSGNRIIPLNEAATQAIERMCSAHPESELIVCSSKGTMVTHQRVERTFTRILSNVGIEQAGPHSLRHTFASMLFAQKTDVKTVSELLGHASIQITLNTYIHLIGDPKHSAVAKLDAAI